MPRATCRSARIRWSNGTPCSSIEHGPSTHPSAPATCTTSPRQASRRTRRRFAAWSWRISPPCVRPPRPTAARSGSSPATAAIPNRCSFSTSAQSRSATVRRGRGSPDRATASTSSVLPSTWALPMPTTSTSRGLSHQPASGSLPTPTASGSCSATPTAPNSRRATTSSPGTCATSAATERPHWWSPA